MLHRERIKRERERLGMSFRSAAIAAGWGEDQASRWERVESGDTEDPGFSTLCGMADALGLTVDEMRSDRPTANVFRGVLAECLRIPELKGRLEGTAAGWVAEWREANPPPCPCAAPGDAPAPPRFSRDRVSRITLTGHEPRNYPGFYFGVRLTGG